MRPLCVVLLLGSVLLTGCRTIDTRKEERAAAYDSLPASAKDLVMQGQLAEGMDTNAVYIAWGPPSKIIDEAGPERPQTLWVYLENRAVHTPTWRYLPNPNGYWTLEPMTEHQSRTSPKGEVVFQQGRVVHWTRF